MKDDSTVNRLRASMDRLADALEPAPQQTVPPAPIEPTLSAEQQAELRHRVFGDHNSPFRRAQDRKVAFLRGKREAAALDTRRYQRPHPEEDQ